MHELSYIITSAPRSGTGYIAKVLNRLGLNCTHEGRFGPTYQLYLDRSQTLFGDSSWLAVPHIRFLPANSIVLHQIRDPIKTLNSSLKAHLGEYSSLLKEWNVRPTEPYARFIWDNTTDWRWAESEIERLMQFWVGWHLWIEYESNKRSDLKYVRYKIEELNLDKLTEIVNIISPNNSLNEADIWRALRAVPNDYNHYYEPGSEFSLEIIPERLKLLARRYGYLEY